MALFSNGSAATAAIATDGVSLLTTAAAAAANGIPGGTAAAAATNSAAASPYFYVGDAASTAAFWSELLVAANRSLALGAEANATTAALDETSDEQQEHTSYPLAQAVIIALLAGCLSLITVVGNFMVMISFKMDKQLQTISNYFLLSLAVADFAIGLISMPLFTIYLLLGSWPFGALLCDSWLSLDYLVSNASVLNLLIISFDRYFSVTRPLTYRARRTTKRAIFMISCAWIVSLILWPPWIFAWPYIEGKRTVEKHKCYIQFIKTNSIVTFGTAIAAFYIPVSIMSILYWQIWRETEKRQKDLTNLQAVKKDNSKRSTSSDDVVEQEENKRSRSDSSAATVQTAVVPVAAATQTAGNVADLEIETTYVPTAMCVENTRYLKVPGKTKKKTFAEIVCSTCFKYCKIDRDVPEYVEEDSTSDAGHGSPGNTTPASAETPVQSSVSRCTSLTLKQDPLTAVAAATTEKTAARARLDAMIPLLDRTMTTTGNGVRGGGGVLQSAGCGRFQAQSRSPSSDSVYTILIRLPLDNISEAMDNQPSIRMIAEEEEAARPTPFLYQQRTDAVSTGRRKESPRFERASSQGSEASGAATLPGVVHSISEQCSLHPVVSTTIGGCAQTALNRRISQPPDTVKLPLNTKLVPKQVMTKAAKKKKKKTQERKQDRKAAKTLSAILLAFIITWTPYNILVLVQTLAPCGDKCVPYQIWDLVYYLCYINSTVNPLCYALCNASFRRTYVRILTCKWHTKKRNPNRGFYN